WATVNTRAAIDRYGDRVERFQQERARALLQDVYDFNQDLTQLQDPVHQIALLFSQRVAVVDDKGFVVADSHNFPFDPEGKLEKETERFRKNSGLKTVPLHLGKDLSGKVIFTESETDNRPAFRVWLDIAPPPRFRSFIGSERRLFGTAEPSGPTTINSTSEVEIFVHEVDEVQDSAAFFDEVVSELSIEPPLSALQDEFQKSLMVSGVTGGIAGILIIAFFTRRAFAPMRELTETAERLGKGELDQRVSQNHGGEIGQLASAFNTMASELETAETRRRRLTADIAHELRTPLTNIRGYLEAVKDGVVEPDADTIETLHNETLHLSTLVEDLRLLAIADAGALKLEMFPDRIETIVESVVQASKPRSIDAGVELVSEIADELPLVEIDRTRMIQVLQNLIENAIQHSPPDSQVILRVDQIEENRSVQISVSDQGDGIPEADIGHLFDQFYRVDTSRTRSTGGAGLGLTIVKRLVEAHGGYISVTSEIGDGSTFVVELPGYGPANGED
ncbi:MAG: HAMP domain-containing histidine kinase, partial [Chloroflexi bacterium]|nr:HAMP domain-containing histidine kinase [Chloroflexota bacterium]